MGVIKYRRRIIAPGFGGISVSSDIVRVNTVAGLEAALAAQKAKQTIEIESGVYQLTKSSPIIAAASYGVLKGIGDVQIDGFATADECFEVDPAACASTFKYTFENIRIRGATAKAGVTVDNASVGAKIVLVFRDCSIGGTPGIDQSHSDDSEAIRIYCDGWRGDKRYQGAINITPASVDDVFVFKGVELSGGLVGAVVDKACYYLFRNCILMEHGITGGHANNLISFVGCITYVNGVAAAADSGECPGAFNPTIV